MTQPIPTKHLLLFRHAKSDWGTATEDDHARPLTKRGIAAARAMGRILAASGQMPDRIVTSSAVRAKTTLEVARAAGKWKCQTEISDALYDTDAAAVLEEIRALPKSATTVLFVGHEPTWSELASFLIGGGNLRVSDRGIGPYRFDRSRLACGDLWSGRTRLAPPAQVFHQGKISTEEAGCGKLADTGGQKKRAITPQKEGGL